MSTVLGWIKNVFSSAAATADAVLHAANRVVSWLWSLLSKEFDSVHKAWNDMLTGAEFVRNIAYDIAHDTWLFGHWLVKTALPDLRKWAQKLVDAAEVAAQALVNTARSWVSGLINDLRDALDSLKKWVLASVWQPLKVDFTQAWDWITGHGAVLWHYVTHPDTLAQLLLAPLYSLALMTLKGSQKQLAQWFLASALSALVGLAGWIEGVFTDLV